MSLELNEFYPGYAKCCKRRKVQSRRSLSAVPMFCQVSNVNIDAGTGYDGERSLWGTLFIMSVEPPRLQGQAPWGGRTTLKMCFGRGYRRIPR